jgi:hypothetical protein
MSSTLPVTRLGAVLPLLASLGWAGCSLVRTPLVGESPRPDGGADGSVEERDAPRSDDAPRGTCGDGVRSADEACEGDDLGGETCASRGFALGALRCGSDCALDVSGCFTPPAGWLDPACAVRVPITVSAGAVAEPLDDLPLLVRGSLVGPADPASLAFASADGRLRFSHALERFDPAAGTFEAWVRVPRLEPDRDTSLFLYAGTAACAGTAPASAVWDAAFVAVYPLGDGGSSPRRDLTSAARSATASGFGASAPAVGWVGGGDGLDGADDRLELPAALTSGLRTFTACLAVATTERGTSGTAWLQPTLLGVVTDGFRSNDLGVMTRDGRVVLRSGLCAGDDMQSTPGRSVADGAWHHICVAGDATVTRLFVDGVEAARVCGVARPLTSFPVWVGGTNGESAADRGAYHEGRFDQLELSNVVRSEAWIAARAANLTDAPGFARVGPPETVRP